MGDFKIPPVSVLLGSTTSNFIRVIRAGRVEPRYYHIVLFSFLITLVGAPFRLWDLIRGNTSKIKEDAPIFIIGHWRSGTTFLHNLLCQDPNMAFLSTYQSIFPHNLYSKGVFKSFVRWKIPDKRPSDNVKLGADLPQEDDFAMANIIPSFYCFFFFPDHYQKYYNRHVAFTEGKHYAQEWQTAYKKLILSAKKNTGGNITVFKNPANTARIKQLLQIYPNAKFIHIYRNPVTVYLSTKKFFLSLFPTIELQKSNPKQIQEIIFDLYARIMRDYFDQKELIPEKNLFEMAYEDFELNPLDNSRDIYTQLELGNWEKAEPYFRAYLKDIGVYKKNTYKISKQELNRIMEEWDFAFEKLGYGQKHEVEVV